MDDYYTFLDKAGVDKTYDWSSLNIDLNFNKAEIDIDAILNNSKIFGNSQNEALFIHEYVHYLQNFYTSWGGLVFCEFVLALEKMDASKVDEHFKLPLPLQIQNQSGTKLWNDGVSHYEKFHSLLGTDHGKISIERIGTYPHYSVKEMVDQVLTINNGLISYQISSKTVREHMAELCSLLFLNYSDQQIHERFINANSFRSAPNRLDKSPMYWMLFEYFYNNGYKDIAEGLVLLTHSALCTANPVNLVVRLFKFLVNYKEFDNKNLFEVVSGFLSLPDNVIAFSYSFNASLEKIIAQLKLCSKIEKHALYHFNAIIFTQLMQNIYSSFSSKKMFSNPYHLRKKETWFSLIQQAGTPIIRYKDKMPVITTSNQQLVEALTYFFGIVKVLGNLQDSQIHSCPFHTEFNICKASYKDNDRCLHEPLSVRNPKQDGQECLYDNAIVLLGLKERISR